LRYPGGLLQPLAQETALCYRPAPFGLLAARQAIADDFARRGIDLPADRVILTASTSEAYSLLFKLLCDPGDVVLAPRPSYPLIEHLTELDAVAVEHYSLEYEGSWSIDCDGLREKLRTIGQERPLRAIIAISPNNPTGSVLTSTDWDMLARLAREHDLALIADEVFADYPLDGDRTPFPFPSALAQDQALVFGLGGLSKTVGLPQVKLGWIGINGPRTLVEEALDRLETICDAYLSVSTPVQVAASRLLELGSDVRVQIQNRVRANYQRLRKIATNHPACSVLAAEGGWYGVIQVPAIKSEETLVVDLLEQSGILVHPGYFFDFEREAYLVISLLPDTSTFTSAIETLFSEIRKV
jgi:aspartate/methionine/tyrosine aminotransferase